MQAPCVLFPGSHRCRPQNHALLLKSELLLTCLCFALCSTAPSTALQVPCGLANAMLALQFTC